MTNFDFLLTDPQFTPFAEAAVAAEKIYAIDPAACALNCRRCVEFAVKWMYSVDGALVMPYDDRLASLMGAEDFRDIVGRDLWLRLKYIRQTGNDAAHAGKRITPPQARLCLENLWYFMDFVACCYGTSYTAGTFDPGLLERQDAAVHKPVEDFLDPVDFIFVMEDGRPIRDRKVWLEKTEKFVEETIVYDIENKLLLAIMKDITAEERENRRTQELRQQTLEVTDRIIQKQMRTVQEIASLLGETTAETKVALTKLRGAVAEGEKHE